MLQNNVDFQFFVKENDQHYHKVWVAAINPKEFQRLVKFENCELIPVPSICEEIALKLDEIARALVANELHVVSKPIRSFSVASQLFIGLIYVHEQQVKFLYDAAMRFTLQTKFPIEQEKNVAKSGSDEEPYEFAKRLLTKKAPKRKSTSTKTRGGPKRRAQFVIDSSDEDIEAQTIATMELLRNAVVSNNADISIREPPDEPDSNEAMQCNEEPEPSCVDNAELEADLISMTLDQLQVTDEAVVPVVMLESSEPRNSEVVADDNVSIEPTNIESPEIVPDEVVAMDLAPVIDPIDMDTMEDIQDPASIDVTSRKRKRVRRKQPFKDLTMILNVKENLLTAATTQRHLTSKDDCVMKASCLTNLSRTIFDQPSHSIFSDSMARQFESRSMSHKLMQSFQRMTLTKTEETNRDLVQEFLTNVQNDNEPLNQLLPSIENTMVDVTPQCQGIELSQQMAELSVVEFNSQPDSVPHDEHSANPLIDIPADNDQRIPIDLSEAIREMLIANAPSNPFVVCNTDSQKLFASRSRQNKLDWGTEGVLKKLMLLWNNGVYPIGMNEIMESHSVQRISAATAFFSIMDLNSTRIGLITITTSPNSNTIYNIEKSQKLIELQQMA